MDIGSIITIVFFVLVALSALKGFLKGRKYVWQYTLTRLIVVIVSAVIALFVTKAVSKTLADMLLKMLVSEGDGEIKEVLEVFTSVPGIIKAFVCAIVAPILFILIHFIVKLIVRIFSPLIRKLIMLISGKVKNRPKKNKGNEEEEVSSADAEIIEELQEEEILPITEEEEPEEVENPKSRKARKKARKMAYRATKLNPVSVVFGILAGLISMVVLFAPFTGMLSLLAPNIDVANEILETAKKDGEDVESIAETVEMLDGIVNNAAVKTVNFAGGKLIYNTLTTYKVNSVKIRLSTELNLITTMAGSAMTITDETASIDTQLDALDNIVDAFNDSAVIPLLMSDFLSGASKAWSEGEEFIGMESPSSDESVGSTLITEMLSLFKNCTVETVKEDFTTLSKIAKILIEGDLINNPPEDPEDLFEKNDMIKALLKEFFANDRLNSLIDVLSDIGIEALADGIGIPHDLEGAYDKMIAEILELKTVSTEEELKEGLGNTFAKYGIDITSDSLDALTVSLSNKYGSNPDSVTADVLKNELNAIVINAGDSTKTINLGNEEAFKENTLIVTAADIIEASGNKVTKPDKEADALANIFSGLSEVTDLADSEEPEVSAILKAMGKLLDKFAATETMGKACVDKLIVALLQSGEFSESLSMNAIEVTNFANSLIKGSDSSSYEAMMISVGDIIDVLSNTEEEITAENVSEVLENLTPETAEALKHMVTPDMVSDMGVAEESQEAVSDLLTSLFDNIATAKDDGMSDEEYKAETEKIGNILEVTMSMSGSDSEENEDLDVDNYVDSIMDSKIITDTVIESVYGDGDTPKVDPLNTGKQLSDDEKTALEQSLSEKLAESDPADRERNEKLITAVAAYMNTSIQISGDSVIVVNNPVTE